VSDAQKWIPVRSSAISAVAHAGGDLYVAYVSGAIYVYAAVPEHRFRALLDARSKGAFVNDVIKPFYVDRRIN
jgi:hypothetical protein